MSERKPDWIKGDMYPRVLGEDRAFARHVQTCLTCYHCGKDPSCWQCEACTDIVALNIARHRENISLRNPQP